MCITEIDFNHVCFKIICCFSADPCSVELDVCGKYGICHVNTTDPSTFYCECFIGMGGQFCEKGLHLIIFGFSFYLFFLSYFSFFFLFKNVLLFVLKDNLIYYTSDLSKYQSSLHQTGQDVTNKKKKKKHKLNLE